MARRARSISCRARIHAASRQPTAIVRELSLLLLLITSKLPPTDASAIVESCSWTVRAVVRVGTSPDGARAIIDGVGRIEVEGR
jgi:hypothetical protein